ncbi:peptidase [Actinoplanes sp. NPDC023714]|uniref:peptidase n=1 Tax=Actinoplanes sp. NPDC023714 TaxID=3154322 RepID=UPI0033C5EC00
MRAVRLIATASLTAAVALTLAGLPEEPAQAGLPEGPAQAGLPEGPAQAGLAEEPATLAGPATRLATPSPAPAVSSAGTSFLTAVGISPDQPARVSAVTGDYLYWSFTASAGQNPTLAATVALPDSGRTGAQAWTVEVFDGLRRRQACVAGEQSPVADTGASSLTLGCRLRQVRSWAEPWDSDPLPGTYYVRLSSTELPEQDLGLPIDVDLTLTAPEGDTGADQGELEAPLVPVNRPGQVLTAAPPVEEAEETGSGFSVPEFSSRWVWTVGGGVLAAIAGLVGFSWTRRRRP